jgi:hypothetical protein
MIKRERKNNKKQDEKHTRMIKRERKNNKKQDE